MICTIRRSSVCDYMSIASTSPYAVHQTSYRTQMRGWVYLIVLTLTLLNPLACLIHCHAMYQHHAVAGTIYVCDMGVTTMSTPPHGMQPTQPPTINAPQAYYAGVFMVPPALLLLPISAMLARILVQPWHSHPFPPLTPPPQTY